MMEGLSDSDLSWLENYIKSQQNDSLSTKNKERKLDIPFGLNFQEFHNTEISLPIYGYVTPVLCVIVLITNILFVTVFAKLKMNSPTHFVLRCMAVVDTLTIVLPTPTYIYVYTMKNYQEFIPFEVCYVWEYMTVYLPTITHTASIWLTTLLAVQRYICVSYPLNVRLWCGIKRTYFFVIFIFILATGCHLSRFFEYQFIKTKVPSLLDPNKEVTTCFRSPSDFVHGVYVVAYSWVRAVAVNIVPCLAMIVFSTIMLVRIRVAEKRRRTIRRRSTFGSGENEPRDSRITTWLVILIVNSVCIVEMPIAAFYVMVATNLTRGENPISENSHTIEIILNLLVQVSYPIHFVLYCTMSEGFRFALVGMFVKTWRKFQQIIGNSDENNGRTSRSISVVSSDTRSVIFNTI
ncbi:sex peptide receptor-like [Saccostrea cucullata]|uniref:sex peptide receptor-like n=1 Tax=Saccostrea cuccullata TaxID=36930 RepID=UPI002ECFB944